MRDEPDADAPIITTISDEEPQPNEGEPELIDLRHGFSSAGITKSIVRYNPVDDLRRTKIKFVLGPAGGSELEAGSELRRVPCADVAVSFLYALHRAQCPNPPSHLANQIC